VFAPVDFESQSLTDGLVASGFEADAPAVFSWIGVTMYLTTDAIRKTLGAVASCGHGSQMVLTYNQPTSTIDAFSRTVTDTLADAVGQAGEPFISLFTPKAAQALIREEGFRVIQDFGADEARRDYFQSREDVLIAGAQRILIGAVP